MEVQDERQPAPEAPPSLDATGQGQESGQALTGSKKKKKKKSKNKPASHRAARLDLPVETRNRKDTEKRRKLTEILTPYRLPKAMRKHPDIVPPTPGPHPDLKVPEGCRKTLPPEALDDDEERAAGFLHTTEYDRTTELRQLTDPDKLDSWSEDPVLADRMISPPDDACVIDTGPSNQNIPVPELLAQMELPDDPSEVNKVLFELGREMHSAVGLESYHPILSGITQTESGEPEFKGVVVDEEELLRDLE